MGRPATPRWRPSACSGGWGGQTHGRCRHERPPRNLLRTHDCGAAHWWLQLCLLCLPRRLPGCLTGCLVKDSMAHLVVIEVDEQEAHAGVGSRQLEHMGEGGFAARAPGGIELQQGAGEGIFRMGKLMASLVVPCSQPHTGPPTSTTTSCCLCFSRASTSCCTLLMSSMLPGLGCFHQALPGLKKAAGAAGDLRQPGRSGSGDKQWRAVASSSCSGGERWGRDGHAAAVGVRAPALFPYLWRQG